MFFNSWTLDTFAICSIILFVVPIIAFIREKSGKGESE